MATIQEVAKKAGVSVATVSRVINHPERVAVKTRERVEKTIEQLNYEPSILGRNLRKSESRLILVLIPSIANPFYTEIINGIEDTVIKHGYNILLCQTESNPKRAMIYFNLIRNRMADGIISMDPTVDINHLNKLNETYPIIQCSEYDENGTISYVTIDSELAAYEAVNYLIGIGHEKIAFINSDEKYLYARQRRAGYERAFRENNLLVDPELIYYADGIGFELGENVVRDILNRADRPTAIFAVSDILAVGALREFSLNNVRVPEDIALVGFDKINLSSMTYPTLTTIAQPMYEMGCISAQMIINKINGKKVENVILEHKLVVREST